MPAFRTLRPLLLPVLATVTIAATVLPVTAAAATPVCTDGYMGGPPTFLCGDRVFPEADLTREYIQYLPAPGSEFREWQHGMEYLAQLYPRWISVFTLRTHFESDFAVSMGVDQIRSYETGDGLDGHDIFVVKVTDHEVADEGKETLLFSLSVHGDEKGGLEGGARTIEDLAIAAQGGGQIVDGIAGYPSSTGIDPEFHSYEVADVLAQQAVYFIDFNIDGWTAGDVGAPTPGLYTRGNAAGTDLNRQMPTIGRIASSRIPLQESEAYWGNEFMEQVAAAGRGGLMAYGADIHGEGQSRAFADIMYPAGQFDSVKHRQLMSIAERTKSVIDATLYAGLVDTIEELTGGDTGEGIEDTVPIPNTVPTKPARWGTVWDTLGYTDTGFIGDYLASQLGVTGMDYEIAFNHTDVRAYGRPWAVLLQENYINATRAIVKTAMAYAVTIRDEFATFTVEPGGRVGYLANPEPTVGELLPEYLDDLQANATPQHIDDEGNFEASNQQFFVDLAAVVPGGLEAISIGDIAGDPAFLDRVDTLAIADVAFPEDPEGRRVDTGDYVDNLRAWVERGGNLVLTDRALHLLGDLGVVDADAVRDIRVYQPYANIVDGGHAMVTGLRGNARQLSEATLVGYEIGNDASPMTVVDTAAWAAAGGDVVGTTGNNAGTSDDGAQVSVGEVAVGDGIVRIMGGGLPMPTTEESHHPYGLRDYSLTYSGLYIMENAIVHDAANLGKADGDAGVDVDALAAAPGVIPSDTPLPATGGGLSLLGIGLLGMARHVRRHGRRRH